MEITRLQQIFLLDKNFNNILKQSNVKFFEDETSNVIVFCNIFLSIAQKYFVAFEKTKNYDEFLSLNYYNDIKNEFIVKIWTENNFGIPDEELITSLLKYSFFRYKFGNLTNFWEENLLNFFFTFDKEIIENDEELSFLFKNFGILLDKVDEILYKLEYVYNVEKVSPEFLNYFSELFGIHKEDLSLTLDNEAFRSLLKNIKTLYKIKGTKRVFVVFFNLLGFDVEIIETYFDRDKYFDDSEGLINDPSKTSVFHYLTKINPEKRENYPVPNNLIQNTKDIHLLSYIGLNNLGITDIPTSYPCPFDNSYYYLEPNDEQYRYFKTNYVKFNIKSKNKNLSTESVVTINKYIKFFFPINLLLDLRVSADSIEDNFSDNIIFFKYLSYADNNTGKNSADKLIEIYQNAIEEDNDEIKYNLVDTLENPLPYNVALDNIINICSKLIQEKYFVNSPLWEPLKNIFSETFGAYLIRNGMIRTRKYLKYDNNRNMWIPREGEFIERIYYRTLTKVLYFEDVFCFIFKYPDTHFDFAFSNYLITIENLYYVNNDIILPDLSLDTQKSLKENLFAIYKNKMLSFCQKYFN